MNKYNALALSLMLAGYTGAALAETTPFSVQQLVKLNKLHSETLSPDGTKLVYGIKQVAEDSSSESNLFLLDLTHPKALPRQLTGGKGTEHDVVFTKDGQSILFLAGRSGSSQIYRLPLNGGEAVQVSKLPLDINGIKLSPDGKHLVMTLRVYPECDTLQCSKDKFDAEAKRKSTGREYSQLMVRHWDTWHDHARNHLFVAPLTGDVLGEPVNITKGLDTEVPPKPFSGMEEVAFTPDSGAVIFSAKAPGKDQA
ncbi:MAG: TolB family protein, partial [Plesiomonas shigelloides]